MIYIYIYHYSSASLRSCLRALRRHDRKELCGRSAKSQTLPYIITILGKLLCQATLFLELYANKGNVVSLR